MHAINIKAKLYAGFIYAILMLVQGILFVQICLSFYAWSPFGYGPDGLQVLGILILAVFSLVTATINVLIFYRDEMGFAFKKLPFCLALANMIYFMGFVFVPFYSPFNKLEILNLTLIAFFSISYLYCIAKILAASLHFYRETLFIPIKIIALVGIILQSGLTFFSVFVVLESFIH